MKTNSRVLAAREPAIAALVGADGDDFGSDATFGSDWDDMGYDFGYSFAADAPAAASLPAAAVQGIVRQHLETRAVTRQRERLIQPNKGSAVNIEGYEFAVNSALVLGAAAAFSDSNSPDVNLRTNRLTSNAPSVGFAQYTDIKVANVSAIVGGSVDAFSYSPLSNGHQMSLPLLTPSNRARVTGNYSGLPIAGLAIYSMTTGFSGPATMAA
jgi:hypothetical protein